MSPRHLLIALILIFFCVAMVYPLGFVLTQAFIVEGSLSFAYFGTMLSSHFFRDVLFNSMNLAIAVTIVSTAIAYPLALAMSRVAIPFRNIAHACILLPLVSPPFVGAMGVRQAFSRFGTVNLLLMDAGVIEKPIQWLGGGGVLGIIALQSIHLVPILYLTISASLRTAHVSLEEAATICGASRWTVLRRVIVPLSLPGWFAGATLVFIASFTDLGTPLIFEYRAVIPVQIYNMLSDLHENPVGYSFVVFTCVLCIALFSLSRSALSEGSYASSTRAKQGEHYARLPPLARTTLAVSLWGYILLAFLPQIAVVAISLSGEWFLTPFPSSWTLRHFYEVLSHPMTSRSLIISLGLSLTTSLVSLVVGFSSAYLIARGRGFTPRIFELLSILPLAVPGIVFAFGYIGGFAGTLLDNRINPFPLLIIAYAIRRLPAMVRASAAGLQEANIALEEAAHVLGATPFYTARRILFPLLSRHLIVGAILTFAYSMIEVSDSILLALEVKFYPVSKAIYALVARPDGLELACALGTIVMFVMLGAFILSEVVANRGSSKRRLLSVAALLTLIAPLSARADSDELIMVSPHWEGIKEEFERGFARSHKERSGREVTIRWLDIGGTSDIVKYLKTQHRATNGALGIDLIFGGGIDSMMELSRAGILEPAALRPDVVSAIPPRLGGVALYADDRRWYTVALSAFGIVVNASAAERLNLPLPKSWKDLGDPRYFDLVGAADPRKSGSMHAMYEVILQGYGWSDGWKLLSRIARNVRALSGTASQVGKDVGTGEVVVGIAIDTYAGDLVRQFGAERIHFIAPADFTSVNGDGIALLQGAPHKALAVEFMEFVLSPEGQRLLYLKRGAPGGPQRFEIAKLPILPTIYGSGPSNVVLPGAPDQWHHVLPYNGALAGSRWNIVNDLFGVFIIDLHQRLVEQALRDPGSTPPAMPVTEQTVTELSPDGGWGKDPLTRNRLLRGWEREAASSLPRDTTLWDSLRWIPSAVLLLALIKVGVRRVRRHKARNF